MQNIIILGMGLSARDLTAAHLEIIRGADLLMGGRRHLAPFKDLVVPKQVITGAIDEVLATLRAQPAERRVVVLASGDPLLFGIGARIVRDLDPRQVCVVPNVSSIAAAFARISEAWHTAALLSLHGRQDTQPLAMALKTHAHVAVLTDARHTPAWLAGWLRDKDAGHARLAIFEQMGTPAEKVTWSTPAQAAVLKFSVPNMVIVKTDPQALADARRLQIGMPDSAYAHDQGMITKAEVRAVALAKLRLQPGMTLWDLGAGSGAVGIEASVLLGAGRIVAVEQHPERVARIRDNARRYHVYNHDVIQARLPEGMAALPAPARIFIGGGGRDLTAIVQAAADRLPPGGVIVVNTVLLDNLAPTIHALEALGLSAEVVQLQIARARPMPWSSRFSAENPVWVISGIRKE
jgi:precorrin-6Y C5,15-methyltransferase (decarboxylating)